MSDGFATQLPVARQAPLSMGVSRQEHCSGQPFPTAGDLPDPGVKPASPAMQWVLNHLSHRDPCFLDLLPIQAATEQ